jgi:hypothetical protein
VVQDMLKCANMDPEFLKTVITGDQTFLVCVRPLMPHTKFYTRTKTQEKL